MNASASRRQRLAQARLYVLLDGGPSPQQFQQRVQQLVDAGVHLIQLRDKDRDDRTLVQRARLLRELTRPTETLFIMNDRPDIGLLADADGVHVGQEELPVTDVRRVAGPERLIGVSTHTIQQARQAVADGADYIGCGPTFASSTKSFDSFAGLSFLTEVASEIRLPAFAIGGINPANLEQVLRTGLRRVAVSGAVNDAATVTQTVAELLERLAEPG